MKPHALVHDAFYCEWPQFQGGLTLSYPIKRDGWRIVANYQNADDSIYNDTGMREAPMKCRRRPEYLLG